MNRRRPAPASSNGTTLVASVSAGFWSRLHRPRHSRSCPVLAAMPAPRARSFSRQALLQIRHRFRFGERQLVSKFSAQQQKIGASLNENRYDREVPYMGDLEARHAREQRRRNGKESQPAQRRRQRRHRVANSLEDARAGEDNSNGNEIQ